MAIRLEYASPRSRKQHRNWIFITTLLVAIFTSGAAWTHWPLKIHGRCQDRVTVNKLGFIELNLALDTFEVDNGRYPTDSEGLTVLVVPPTDKSWKWGGPYLKQLPTDQWGHAYIYHAPVSPQIGYRLLSPGPDGIEGTSDDILPGN